MKAYRINAQRWLLIRTGKYQLSLRLHPKPANGLGRRGRSFCAGANLQLVKPLLAVPLCILAATEVHLLKPVVHLSVFLRMNGRIV